MDPVLKRFNEYDFEFIPEDMIKHFRTSPNINSSNYFLAFTQTFLVDHIKYTVFMHISNYIYSNLVPTGNAYQKIQRKEWFNNDKSCFALILKDGKSIDYKEEFGKLFSYNQMTAPQDFKGEKHVFVRTNISTILDAIDSLNNNLKTVSKEPTQCRRCGIFDEYAPAEADGKCLCWKCC